MLDSGIYQLNLNENPWRIDWLGDVRYPRHRAGYSQPSVRVALSSPPGLRDNVDDWLSQEIASPSPQSSVMLPVALLPALRIGDIWLQGRLQHSPQYTVETFPAVHIEASTTALVKAGLPESGHHLLPFTHHPWHRHYTDSYGIRIQLPGGRRMFIPCLELIRFYFGSTGNLLSRLFTQPLEAQTLWRSRQEDAARRHIHLQLATGLSGKSASDVARLALSKTAWRAASKIYQSCVKGMSQGHSAYPAAFFPFEGETTLTARGLWLPFAGQAESTFVVFSLLSCSHPFPFHSLSYETERSSTSRQTPPVDATHTEDKAPKVVRRTSGESDLVETDPNPGRHPQRQWVNAQHKFPDLTRKAIWRDKLEQSDNPEIYLRDAQGRLKQLAAGEPLGPSQAPARLDLAFQDDAAQQSMDAHGKLPRFVTVGLAEIQVLMRHLPDPQQRIVTAPTHASAIFNLPLVADAEGVVADGVLYTRPGGRTRARRACFVTAFFFGQLVFAHHVIVEGQDTFSKPRVLKVSELSIPAALDALFKDPTSTSPYN